MDYFSGPSVYCHGCMEPGISRLVAEGARDDEVLPAFEHLPIPERRWIEAALTRLRAGHAAADPRLSALQRDVLARLPAEAAKLRRNRADRRAPDAALGPALGIRRETLARWRGLGILPDY
jgi:hypothetical protein